MFKRVNILTAFTPAIIGIVSVILTIIATCIATTSNLTRDMTVIIGLFVIGGYVLVSLPYVIYIIGLGSPRHIARKWLYFTGLIIQSLYYIPAVVAPAFSMDMITDRNIIASVFAVLAVIAYVVSIFWFLITTHTFSLFLSKKSDTKEKH